MTEQSASYGSYELILVLDPEAQIRVREREIATLADNVDVAPLMRLLSDAQAFIRPLYGVSEEWLTYRTSFMPIEMGRNQRLNLSIFYKITCPHDNVSALLDRLRELPIVQAAYRKPRAALPFIDIRSEEHDEEFNFAASDDFTRLQEYLNSAAEGGIDARYAWTQSGGRGQNIKLVDIEGAWAFSHEDLVDNPSGCVGGIPIKSKIWRKHGTAVLGMLGGDHNGFGVSGICPDADVRTVSIFANPEGEESPDWDSAAAIRFAADTLCPGSIILLELHRPGPAVNFQENEQTQEGYIPVEWWPCDMAAVMYATSLGMIVIAAAGNGQQNLDDRIYDDNPSAPYGPFPPWWVNPFRRDPIDTRSVLVGAGLPPDNTHCSSVGPDRSKIDLSNFGTPVDTQGWGMEVTTCGFNGDLTPLGTPEVKRYTRRFNGTSSAAAMIAGAVCCLQGVAKVKQKLLAPLQVRTLLRDDNLGSPQQDSLTVPAGLQRIGPRPDLKKLIPTL